MAISQAWLGALSKGTHFLARQQRDWKVTAIRTSTYRFLYQMALPYLFIYTIALGATGTQLGLVNSVGMGVAGLVSPFTGWIIDRMGIKRVYLAGIGCLALSYAVYSLAQDWRIIVVAMLAYWLGFATSLHGCTVICANSVAREERATVMSCCETFAAGLLGMAAPMIGALLVTAFGGVSVEGIRPLFVIGLVGTIATFLLVLTQLSSQKQVSPGEASLGFFKDMSQIVKQGHHLGRFLVIASITFLPQGMIIPFAQVFAREFKGADQFVLGAMVTGFALTPLLLGIPMGRLADRIGRKRVLYVLAPLFWASNLLLIWAPNPQFLILSGILQGFFSTTSVITAAMTFEMVPAEQMGRWMGMVRFLRMLLGAMAALMAGIIWDTLGPQYLFLAFVGLDLAIRIPLLIGIPETLAPSAKR